MKPFYAFVLLALGLGGCSSDDSPPPVKSTPPNANTGANSGAPAEGGPLFAARDVGLPQETWGRATEPRAIVEVKGGGFALFDLDGDARLDVFQPGGKSLDPNEPGPRARVFRQVDGGRFAAEEGAVDWHGWAMGAAAGDVTGDGRDDVFVAAHGPDALFVNQGDGTLAEEGAVRGLASEAWGMAAALADLDGDGDLDLYVANYLELDLDDLPPDTDFQGEPIFAGPLGLTPSADLVYENDGTGHFKDKSFRSGILATAPSFGLAVMPIDFDVDGRLDLFVGNDSMANFLFANEGGFRFKDAALQRGLAANGDGRRQATMGVAIGDVNGDSLPDVFTTNFASDTNTLQVSRADRPWRDRTSVMGLTTAGQTQVGWASLLGDYDRDGDEDLVVFNGHVYPERLASKMGSEAAQPALYFERDGARFRAVSEVDALGAWSAARHIDRGGALADYDGDGDLDLFVQEWRGPLRVIQGQAADQAMGSPGLEVVLQQDAGDRFGYGSRVQLVEGGTTRTAWIEPTMGFQSSGAPSAFFTLGAQASREVRVIWPDGHTQTVPLPEGTTGRFVVERDE